ncbi:MULTISPECIES: hypothetical protein [unclassified Cryobacterium]|uniref:hypothetical protein n=1 Tax=unclassified Cryobacterium TaxID=2649013 RepID=UPI001445ACB6|nr:MULTISPECIES: hypothetical protein [unclassified Cryobacterium]
MSKQKKEQELVIGGVPRADLLPREVRQAVRDRRRNRYLVYGVIAAIGVAAVGSVYAFGQSLASQTALVIEQARTDELVSEQAKYSLARETAGQIDDIVKAQRQGAATEIDWKAYFAEIETTLPEGVTVVSVVIDSISPVEELPVQDIPLQQGWVASVTIGVVGETVPDIEAWLNRLAGVTAYAGVAPPVEVSENGGGYAVSVKLLVNSDAYALRFEDAKAPEKSKDAEVEE